jgi:TrmH family RNA methyltransferase
MMIQSSHNPKIQRVRTLLGRRKERQEQNSFVLEGVRLIDEAMRTGALPELLLFSDGSGRAQPLLEQAVANGVETQMVEPSLLETVSDTKTAQGLVGIFQIPTQALPDKPDFILILDSLSDPGNLGAILRSAAAAGVQLVLLTPGTTDAFAPKVVRSAMGAHFYLPIRTLDWEGIRNYGSTVDTIAEPALQFLASDMTGGKSCWDSDLRRPCALIIGSEATGISAQAEAIAHERIHIPMQGKIESLNASAAASILIFEVIRQRTT